ncbi:MAG: decarboxylating 6-phosphogluconate dehydrogenase [Acidobacteria bacterium]|nr:decarboxylating 6-phosphogluconate dehydrogenase [Acidobacteriota bacterium]
MQLGMIGLGRMGGNMVRRLMRAGHECVVFDVSSDAVTAMAAEGAVATSSLTAFVQALRAPRAVWLMVPAALVDAEVEALGALLEADDILVDGGNSRYTDDIRRAVALATKNIHYVDVGTSGGVWGLERGYSLMIGGDQTAVARLDPIFAALAPGEGSISRTPGRDGAPTTAERGYLHCGPSGAGHFVKMVHNGIEYGLMAAYAEGLNVLRHADVGLASRQKDAETTPLTHPEHYQYTFDLGAITEVWRRGSVVASWLLDLSATALVESPDLAGFSGHVSDSGEGRWTIAAAIDESVPVPVLSAALYDRFTSRGEGDFAHQMLSALRYQFGGHHETKAGDTK